MIVKTLKELLNFCLLRGNPAAIPHSYLILFLLMFIVISLDVTKFAQIPQVSVGQALLATLLSRSVMLGLLYALLTQKKLQARFIKVIIAFLGTALLLSLFFGLITLLLQLPPTEVSVIAVVLLFWIMLTGGYVLKLALETKLTTGLLLTFGLHFAAFLSTCLIIGEQIKAQIPINPS